MITLISWALATVGGLGHCPIAPGTVASVAAAAAWYAMPLTASGQWLVATVVSAIGLWASHTLAFRWNRRDPSEVVIDEVAGMWVAVAGLPHDPLTVGLALVCFRVFDITKMPPVTWCERLPGGLGIMADDVAAGLMARALTVVMLAVVGR